MVVLRGKKGVYLPLFGSKFKHNFMSNFDGIFLHHVENLFYEVPKKHFSPNGQAVLKLWLF
jgi:hypothetical protein